MWMQNCVSWHSAWTCTQPLPVTSTPHVLHTVVMCKSDRPSLKNIPLPSSKVMKSVGSTLVLQHESLSVSISILTELQKALRNRCLQTVQYMALSEGQPALLLCLLYTQEVSRPYALSTSLIRVTKGYHWSICNTWLTTYTALSLNRVWCTDTDH